MKLAIIGGGIAGLSAAYRAEQFRRSAGLEYVLFEQLPRLGGVIRTEIVEGCVVEAGPDSFLTEKPAAAALCQEIGLGDQLVPSNDALRKTHILVRGRLVPLPDGLQFLVPTKIAPLALTQLFSWSTKLRFLREWLTPPSAVQEDESVAQFVCRHFGDEVVDRLADPLLSGIYGGEAGRLSVRAVLPRMVAMEAKYGSLIRAMLAVRKQGRGHGITAEPPPLFTSLRGGMQQMVEGLAALLDPRCVRLQTTVRGLQFRDGGWTVQSATGGSERDERYDGVILALPAYASGALLQDVGPELASTLTRIAYSSSITIALGYEAQAIGKKVEMEGFGFLVPRSEGKTMMACTFVHRKFPHRAPKGRVLLRCFIGGDNAETAMELSDAEILASVRRELRDIIGLSAEPLFSRVSRWKRAMAQYEVGHLERLATIEHLRRQLPGLALAGNAYRGIGVPDRIAMGAAAVAEFTGKTQAVVSSQP